MPACPVPEDQQPLNEYKELRESWFFQWGTLQLSGYLLKLLCVWSLSWLISGPVAAASFPPAKHLLQFLLCGSAGATGLLALVLLQLYLGWAYVGDRLKRPTVSYEESGWYDGQIWAKTPEVQNQDQLIVTYQVQPILQRLQRTLSGLFLLCLAGSLLWVSL